VLFVIAVLTLPVYITGAAAQKDIRDRPGVSATAIRVHQDAALGGFAMTEVAGFVAWIALWQSRRRGRAARGFVTATMVLLFLALALSGRAANLGGEIRHPEILTASAGLDPPAASAGDESAAGNERFLTAAIASYMVNSRWAWPAAETVHFLGLSLTFAVLLAVNLRILGMLKQWTFADVHRLLPWGMLGFGANLVTGMLFFIGQPGQYIESSPFYWKVILLMIAGANFLYLTVFTKAWAGKELTSNAVDKAMALTSLASWLGILFAGRMLPFLGLSF
jgi:hypothetical protein